MTNYFEFDSPIGGIAVTDNSHSITSLLFLRDKPINKELKPSRLAVMAQAELEEYFRGERRSFSVPIDPQGTDFQRKVWAELVKLPYGETFSYKEIAVRIGTPKACRAVGGANNKNPIPIIIPCHRVVGADGSLSGYGGGTDIKQFLLALENRISKKLK